MKGRRNRWLEGRFAKVDGIPFRMPVTSKDSPVLLAGFSIDPDAAVALLPGNELHPVRLWKRGVLTITVVDYRETVIGKYVEFFVGILCTRGLRPAPRLLPLALMKTFGTGAYIHDLPVSSEISVHGGRAIWGMPKRQANLDFVIGETTVSSQYDLDGRIVLRIDVERPRRSWIPVRAKGVGYGAMRGMLYKSYVGFRGKCGLSLFKRGSARLLLGDHPLAEPLKGLDLDPRPLFSGFFPKTSGILEDHVETWYLTHDEMPDEMDGIETFHGLGLSEEWLEPPDRAEGDRRMRELEEADTNRR